MTQQDIRALTEIIVSTQNQLGEQLADFKSDIDARFAKIETRLDRFDGRLDQLEESTRRGFDRVNSVLDGIVVRLDVDDSERLALTAQVDQQETWISRAAPEVGVTYTSGS